MASRRSRGKAWGGDVPETNVGNIGGRFGSSLDFGFEWFSPDSSLGI